MSCGKVKGSPWGPEGVAPVTGSVVHLLWDLDWMTRVKGQVLTHPER